MRLIAGLDVGTTGCKVTVFTAEGENLGREYRDYPVRRAVDAQEVDAVALGESVLECVKAAQSRFGRIEALGVTSFGEAFVLADENGCAVGAFNTPTFVNVTAVISAAEKLGTPVIISHAETGIDALAASFGTAHGIYKVKPKLDFDRIRKIRELTGVPLVMHGGSGVSPEDYRTAISCGVSKINYYSYMARAGRNAVAEKLASGDVTFFHVLADEATRAMETDVTKAMKVFVGI